MADNNETVNTSNNVPAATPKPTQGPTGAPSTAPARTPGGAPAYSRGQGQGSRDGGFRRRFGGSGTGSAGGAPSQNRGERRPFGDRNRPGGSTGPNRGGPNDRNRGKFGRSQRPKDEEESSLQSTVITVKRITRVVKGGKRMRFAALVVAGDKAGSVGYGFKKGLDYQDAVKKATKQAGKNLLKVKLNDNKSIAFPTSMKFKAAKIFLKPAFAGTGLIAGGFIRPVLELAGIENIYSKIIGSRNKVTGVQAAFEALKKYS